MLAPEFVELGPRVHPSAARAFQTNLRLSTNFDNSFTSTGHRKFLSRVKLFTQTKFFRFQQDRKDSDHAASTPQELARLAREKN